MLNRGVLGAIGPRKAVVVAGYQGLGDVISSGWLAYWGMRALSNATIGDDAVRLRKSPSDGEQTFITESNGHVDLAAIETFRGGETLDIKQLYNQVGAYRHFVSPTAVFNPPFLASALNSLPGIDIVAASDHKMTATTDTTDTGAYSVVLLIRHETSSGAQVAFSIASPNVSFYFREGGNNTVAIYDGSGGMIGTCSDNTYHSVVWVVDGASSAIYVDSAVVASGTSIASNFGATDWALGFNINFGGQGFDGQIIELAAHTDALSSGQVAAIYANHQAVYGI